MRFRPLALLLLAALVLAGCGSPLPATSGAPASPAAAVPTQSPAATPLPPTDSPTEAPTAAPTATEVATLVPTPAASPTLRVSVPVLRTTPPGVQPTAPGGPNMPDSGSQVVVNQARADLASRLGVAESAIVIKTVQAQEWPDASLGCLKAGIMYAQVITPGYLIVLEANGKQYEYHASGTRAVLCTK